MEQMEIETGDEATRLILGSRLDIGMAEILKQSFQEVIAKGKIAIIDARRVGQISTPCIQVILSAVKTMERDGVDFALFRPSEEFAAAFESMGLFPTLMKWKVIS
jgi:anti-anti-sigma factor